MGVGRPVSGEKFSGKSVTWSQGQRRHPEPGQPRKDADLRQYRGMEDAQGDRGGQTAADPITPRAGQSSPAAFPKAAAAVAT